MKLLRAVPLLFLALALSVATPGLVAAERPPAPPAKEETKPDPRAEVAGTVVLPGGTPVPGAIVRIRAMADPKAPRPPKRDSEPSQPSVAKTAEDGSFRARGLEGSVFAVRVEAGAFAPFTAKDIPVGATLRVVLKPGAEVVGRVFDFVRKEGLPGATVLAWDPDAGLFGEDACRRAVTGDDGRFRIAGVPIGNVVLEASARGHVRARQRPITARLAAEGSVPPAENLIYLRPGGRVSGRVVLASGKPADGVHVEVTPADRDADLALRDADLPAVTTDASGKFAFDGVPAGARVRMRGVKKGAPFAESEPVAVEAGVERSGIEIRLEEGAALEVRLVDRDGKGVSGLDVRVVEAGKRTGGLVRYGDRLVAPDQIERGDGGRFTVRALKPGTCTVRLLPEGFEDLEREEVKLRSGETVDLGTLTVSEGRSVTGRVTDAMGVPVAGATVEGLWTAQRERKRRSGKTSADGSYRLGGLGESPLRDLSIRAEGFVVAHKEDVPTGSDGVDFVLERNGSVVGKVVVPGGEPAAAFRVKVLAEARGPEDLVGFRSGAGERIESVFSGPSGLFRIAGIEPGTYTVEASATGMAPARKAGVRIESERDADVGILELEKGAVVSGRVLDARGDVPVADAAVRLSPPRVFSWGVDARGDDDASVTGPDGSFRIEGITAGASSVDVAHPDFSPATVRVEIVAGADPPEVVVRLTRGGTLAGTVRDAAKRPVQGATILISSRMVGGGDVRSATTDTNGRYIEDKLRAGTYQVLHAPERGGPPAIGLGFKTTTIRDGETTVLDFDEAPPISLSGRVLCGGRPVPSALLFFMTGTRLTDGDVKIAQADGEGKYSIGLDRGGTYRVMARTGAHGGSAGGATVELTVPEIPEPVLDIVLQMSAISGTVKDEAGEPVKNATVVARRDGDEPTDRYSEGIGRSDVTGAFSIEGLAPGAYRVTAIAPGYRMAEVYPVGLPAGQAPDPLDLVLARGRELRGRVVDPQGRGIEGALVFLAPSGSMATAAPISAESDVNGTFVATAPTDDPVDVVAAAPGWAPARSTGVVPAGGTEPDVVLRATAGGTVRALVTGPDGQPVSGVFLAVNSVPPSLADIATAMRQPAPTGLDGTAVLDLLAPGAYLVGIPGRNDVAPAEVRVVEGAEVVATIRLP